MRKKVPFTIVVGDIRELLSKQTVNGELRCAVTGVVLVSERNHPLSPSIDRIDCDLGYCKGNIRVVSLLYNLARRSWDDELALDAFTKTASSWFGSSL